MRGPKSERKERITHTAETQSEQQYTQEATKANERTIKGTGEDKEERREPQVARAAS